MKPSQFIEWKWAVLGVSDTGRSYQLDNGEYLFTADTREKARAFAARKRADGVACRVALLETRELRRR
jgi:hypothetical protein